MKDVQEVFNELQETKKEIKEIRKEYKDSLSHDSEYAELVEKINEIKEEKKQHEMSAQRDMGSRWEQLEDLKAEEKSIKEMISDISLTNLMKGETVEVRDAYDTLYEPNYNISFKKTK